MKKLFIGKLSFSTTEESLRSAFVAYAPISSVKVITDKMTGRSRGFGFVELDDNDKAASAISEMDGMMLDGRNIAVSEARPQEGGQGGGFRSGGGFRDGNSRGGGNYRSGGNSRY